MTEEEQRFRKGIATILEVLSWATSGDQALIWVRNSLSILLTGGTVQRPSRKRRR